MTPRGAFQQAIRAADHLDLKDGLQAVRKAEGGGQISARDPRCVLGSADMDEDCKLAFPNDNRWDYVIGYARSRVAIAYFVEVHSAETSSVSKMEEKLAWLDEFLEKDAQRQLATLGREVHWVASAGINIPKHTPQFKKLSTTLRKRGLRGPVKSLELA